MVDRDDLFRNTLCKMWYFIALCSLTVNAQNATDSSTEATKVEPKNISSLYIGDLLRTKPKEDLTAAGSVHRPTVLNQDLQSAASVSNPFLPYKSHGGHEYSEAVHHHPKYPEGRATLSDSVKRVGAQAQNVPFNVKGHILTLKPVRIVAGDNAPTPRNPDRDYKETHYPGDDCSKNSETSYSSEEKPYIPEKPTYRRAKQTASNPELEYRSPPSDYYDDHRSNSYSSQSDPSTGSYRSKTGPSNTNSKSESSGSYTTSKSTSTSKTITPTRSKMSRIIPTVITEKQNYEKTHGPGHRGKGFVVYKAREPSNQNPGSYSESSEKDYPPPSSDYDREHKPAVREPNYSQHSSGPRKSRKYSHGTPTHYSSSEPNDRPQQYRPPSYEEDQGSYEQSSYTPDDDQRYREQNGPPNKNNENKYAQHQYSEAEPERKPYHQSYPVSSGQPSYYNEEPKNKPHRQSKKQPSKQYEKPPNRGKDQGGYRTRGHSTPEYGNPPHESQPARGQSETPQHNYEPYSAQYGHEEVSQTPPSYDRTQPSHRPSEKQSNRYEYEATPQTNTKQTEIHSSHRRPYRESSRYARSSEHPGHAVISAGNEPVVMISRERKPYVSRSESFSESSYDMRLDGNRKASYGQQEKPKATERRHGSDPRYQTSYRPFNSEYPASYTKDQNHHLSARKNAPRAHEQPFEQTPSYNPPAYSQTQSNSEEYPPQQQGQTYDQGEDNEDSYEEGGRPVKKGKNHHYISNIEGYKDTYGRDEPLIINEDFFKKYGISPTAKVIVANAENPNLFVADGTKVKEGEFFGNSGPSSGPSHDLGPNSGPSHDLGPSHESNPDSGYGPPSSAEEENFEPDHKSDYNEDSYSSSPEELGPSKHIPGSFDDLVDTNPKFLRHLPELMKNEDGFFKMDSTEHSFDDVEFPKVEEQRGYVVSQRPGEIVQQHGDGVSRIIFNVPKHEPEAKVSNLPKEQDKEQAEERILEAATKLIENFIKSDS